MQKKLTTEQMNSQNWRYKKKLAPVDEFAHLNGEVKVVKPKATNVQYPDETLQPPTQTTQIKQ